MDSTLLASAVSLDSPFFQAIASIIQSSIATALEDKLGAFNHRILQLELAVSDTLKAASATEAEMTTDPKNRTIDMLTDLDNRLRSIEEKLQVLGNDHEIAEDNIDEILTGMQDLATNVSSLSEDMTLIRQTVLKNLEQTINLENGIENKMDQFVASMKEAGDVHELERHVGELTDGLFQLENAMTQQIDTFGPIVTHAVETSFTRYEDSVEKKKFITQISSSLPSLATISSLSPFGKGGEEPDPSTPNQTMLSRFRKATSFPVTKPQPQPNYAPQSVVVLSRMEPIHEA
ncbi:hypothetical protein HDU98_001193 [Podochytrium sp. JEL0797]|nr:hypothetical protein HDU98_001193 [Podochytrium sp. JEL0797]